MKVTCVWEHNGNDSLLYSSNFIGAYTRGESKEIAISKMEKEIVSYSKWVGVPLSSSFCVEIVQEKKSILEIKDADSDVIFDEERLPLTLEEYTELKTLVLKSAKDFLDMYNSISDKDSSVLPVRQTFYGQAPRSAREMYEHTKNVNAYYFGEIDVDADNDDDIYKCRCRGLERLEQRTDFLNNTVIDGSYGEEWSLRKVMRRFIWHDRIHARAMYRMAIKTFGINGVDNPFCF